MRVDRVHRRTGKVAQKVLSPKPRIRSALINRPRSSRQRRQFQSVRARIVRAGREGSARKDKVSRVIERPITVSVRK
jgi:hypothetical protein